MSARPSLPRRALQGVGWVLLVLTLGWAATRAPREARALRAPANGEVRVDGAAADAWRAPPGVRALVLIDLEMLRGEQWFDPWRSASREQLPCVMRALEHTRRAAIVLDGAALEDALVAFTGPIDGGALLRCSSNSPGESQAVRAQRYRGVLVSSSATRAQRADETSPAFARIDSTLALFGHPTLLRRTLDHQLAPGGPQGDEALEALLARLPSTSGATALLVALRGNLTGLFDRGGAETRAAGAAAEASLSGVRGAVGRVQLDRDGAQFELLLASEDYDSPARVRDVLRALLERAVEQAPVGSLRAMLSRVRVERDATHVLAALRTSRSETVALVALLAAIASERSDAEDPRASDASGRVDR